MSGARLDKYIIVNFSYIYYNSKRSTGTGNHMHKNRYTYAICSEEMFLLSMNKTYQKSFKYETKRGWRGKGGGLCRGCLIS